MINKVKLALRISGTAYDSEVEMLIKAAIADIRLVGIQVPSGDVGSLETLGDPLLDRAVVLYCKANFGYDDESERFKRAYEYLRCTLSLSREYLGGTP